MHVTLLVFQYLAIVNKENTNDHTRKLNTGLQQALSR